MPLVTAAVDGDDSKPMTEIYCRIWAPNWVRTFVEVMSDVVEPIELAHSCADVNCERLIERNMRSRQ